MNRKMKFLYSTATLVGFFGALLSFDSFASAFKPATQKPGQQMPAAQTRNLQNNILNDDEVDFTMMTPFINVANTGAAHVTASKMMDKEDMMKDATVNDVAQATVRVQMNEVNMAVFVGYYYMIAVKKSLAAAFGVIMGADTAILPTGAVSAVSRCLMEARLCLNLASHYRSKLSASVSLADEFGSNKYQQQVNQLIDGIFAGIEIAPIRDNMASSIEQMIEIATKLVIAVEENNLAIKDSNPDRKAAIKTVLEGLIECSKKLPENLHALDFSTIFPDRDLSKEKTAFKKKNEDDIFQVTNEKLPKLFNKSKAWEDIKGYMKKLNESVETSKKVVESVKAVLKF